MSEDMRRGLADAKARRGRPILVTGLPRSGTTWVGRVLSQSPGTIYMHEPFNRHSGWAPFFPTPDNFLYLDPKSPSIFDASAEHMTGLTLPVRANPSELEFAAYNRVLTAAKSTDGKLRPVLKDPIALLGAEWLAERHRCQVVMTLRHPLEIVQSLLRLDWAKSMTIRFFTHQPLAAERYLRADELASIEMQPGMPVEDRAAKFVRALLLASRSLLERHPEWHVLEHRALVADPAAHFGPLFEHLDLPVPADLMADFMRGDTGIHDGSAHQKELRPIADSADARPSGPPDLDLKLIWDTYLVDVVDQLRPWADWAEPA